MIKLGLLDRLDMGIWDLLTTSIWWDGVWKKRVVCKKRRYKTFTQNVLAGEVI